MSETRFNIPVETWDATVDEIHDLLVPVAHRRETIPYGDVVARLSAVTREPDSSAFHHMLGDVSSRTFDEGAPLLSAVVVHKGDGRPGGGFAKLARRLGFDVAEDPLAEEIFWAQQLEAVHEWWRKR